MSAYVNIACRLLSTTENNKSAYNDNPISAMKREHIWNPMESNLRSNRAVVREEKAENRIVRNRSSAFFEAGEVATEEVGFLAVTNKHLGYL
jgi:hypothetical protein